MQTTGLRGAPLSLQQHRLWSFLQESSIYRVQGSFLLNGQVDYHSFLEALHQLSEQHEIFRTVFQRLKGMEIPVQVIGYDTGLVCTFIDMEAIASEEQRVLLEQCYAHLQEQPFDLLHGPLTKVLLFRTFPEQHQLFISSTALCMDACTLPLFVTDLMRVYEACLQHNVLDLDPLQYTAVCAWQNELREAEDAKVTQEHWQRIDLERLAQMQLPFMPAKRMVSYAAPEQPFCFNPQSFPISIDEDLLSRLPSLADLLHISLPGLLFTCWQGVLWRLIADDRLLIGLTCDGRDDEELTSSLGPYSRIVPVELLFDGQWTFAQAATATQQALDLASRWQTYFVWPSEKGQGEGRGRNDYFPIVFEYAHWPASIHGETISASLSRQSSCVEPFVLKLHVLQRDEHLELELQYNLAVFQHATAQRLGESLRTLLAAVLAEPQARIQDLAVVNAEQQARLLHRFYAPRIPLSAASFGQLFERQAQRIPHQLALISAQGSLTYHYVNARANQLARILRRYGVGPNTSVGLCLQRSSWMIISILAIFKAGGAYVPCDPESPAARLLYQIGDMQAPLLLAQRSSLPALQEWSGEILYLETLWQMMDQEEDDDLGIPVQLEDLAYVMYTSGSTGSPKGVMISQRNIVHYTTAICELLQPEPGWQYATVSTLAADLGNTAIFCSLASGGCLHILDYATLTSSSAFRRWNTRNPIDVLKVVPSHLHALLSNEESADLLPRRALLLGGEILTSRLVARIRALGASCDIYNHYGPTETTIGVLVNRLAQSAPFDTGESDSIPVGRPIANTDVYVLDSSFQIVPEDVTGELFIGGLGLSAGYLHRPEQTAERFIPHPFSKDEGARLYRTGDQVRYTADGLIEFVGRRDNQVKLRGYRIELGEIEAVLRRHSNIWDCVVIMRAGETEDASIIGYIVPKELPAPTSEELNALLALYLPAYMIPSVFVSLRDLPLTANGKVDRKRLPEPERHKEEARTGETAPRSPIEEILLDIWKSLLSLPSLSIHDDFFQVGGHSLLATQVIARVQAILRVEISLASLFEAPTIAELAQRVEEALSSDEEAKLPPLSPVERTQNLPLSFAQQRLWFLDQLEPESIAYLVRNARNLTGKLHVSALERALEALIQRHESLRTTFEVRGGKAVQLIWPLRNFHFPLIDLQELADEERVTVARQIAAQQGRQPFNLASLPLIRAMLLRLEPQEHIILWTMHHIISDAWSSGIFIRELTELYRAFSAGKASPLSPLPIQYADFAVWQRQWLRGAVLEKKLAYWRQQLAGIRPLELPFDHPRPAKKTYQGALLSSSLPGELQAKLIALSQREGVTLFMTLLAAFQVLLFRYTGQPDISVGTPIANRTRAELEGLIGFFVNTLVLRTDLAGNPSFRDLLKRVHETALEAYIHQDVPFEYLVDMLQPERDLSRSPLFQVMFSMQQTGGSGEAAAHSQAERPAVQNLHPEHITTKFDLTFAVFSNPQGLYCNAEYNTDLFEHDTIARLLEHWQILLEHIVTQPETVLSDLRLLSEAERQRVLATYNPPSQEEASNSCLHTLFEQQVIRRPDAIALVFGDEYLTYAQLNACANHVAHLLKRAGVAGSDNGGTSLEVLVGLALEPSPLLMIGLLGILKASAAYVPLDPSHPAERLAFMLADSQISVLLTQQSLVEKIPAQRVQVICLDRDWQTIVREPDQNPPQSTLAGQVAYIIYTSGSTGTPKGVMVSHANVLSLFSATQPLYHFNENDAWTLFHSYAFDFSVWEIWGALLYGGRLIVLPHEVRRAPEALYSLLTHHDVTVLNQTPSAFRQLMQVEAKDEAQQELALRLIIFGGEALQMQSLRSWFERHGEQKPQLVNMYGITETTVHVTYRPVRMRDTLRDAWSAIGVPIPSLQVYVLDDYMQPVPIGVPGQMYVGGFGLSRGYLKRPELASERFVPHPFSSEGGARLYKTGDLARLLPDGDLEYLGRTDQQIKLRGFRIELGEIEACLSQHPGVQECVVLMREDVPGDRRLVAYIVPRPQLALASGELRSFSSKKLPDYMVPAFFISLESLPLTPNGKLDQHALPPPDHLRPDLGEVLVSPRTATEEVLAAIWSSVLGLEQVGIHDNFFALGGDSIRSIQILSLAREKGLHFSLQQLFQHQTIYELTQAIGAEEQENFVREPIAPFSLIASPEDLQRLPSDVEDGYPLTALQAGMFFHSQYSSDAAVYHDITSYHLQLPFNYSLLRDTLERLIACHPILRTSFEVSSFSEPLQLVHRTVDLPLLVTDLRLCSPDEQEHILAVWREEDKLHPFDLAHAPLIRFHIHLRTEDTFQFTLSCHHAILDGWSMASLLTELFKTYLARLGGNETILISPPRLQFRDFVALEQRAIATQEARQYWAEKLRGCSSASLPRWRTSSEKTTEAATVNLAVPISLETSAALMELSRSLAVPLKSVLLAAHLRVLSVLYGQSDILSGLVANGRPETTDGERVLGLFLNTLPFRMKLSGGTWVELVQEVFANECELLPYRRYPLANIQREQGGHDLFEVIFNFTHFHVYKDIVAPNDSPDELRVLGREGYEKTNFVLAANFSVLPASTHVALSLRCNTTEIGREQLEAIGVYYLNTLTALVNEPGGRYEFQIPLSRQEHRQVLLDWNATQAEYAREKCIHELFEAQVEHTPDAIALTYDDQMLSYSTLNRHANQLAHQLIAQGVAAETLVGIYMDRSLEMLVGLLGVLKAGGAYVPLDPTYPLDRLTYIMQDSRVTLLVTQPWFADTLQSENIQLICLSPGGLTPALQDRGEDNPARSILAEQLAYVIYTSGSTGRPKGVAITHRSVGNIFNSVERESGIGPQDEMLAVTSLSFDIAALELLLPLMVGARVHLISREVAADGAELALALATRGATIMQATPTTWRMLLNEGWMGSDRLSILCGGEVLPLELALQLRARGKRLWNMYGPTETTIWSASGEINGDESLVSIGRAIGNTQIYLLDAYLMPVPVGVVGDLYIAGDGLARGYFLRPELSAEQFVPNPFSSQVGDRMYHTGDLARWLPNGTIECLGRGDRQVKVRGFRIELGEIETTLGQHEAVRECAVVAGESQTGEMHLVAYLVLAQGYAATAHELRAFLQQRLPEYMLPSAFLVLTALPLTPNGKIDRQALPAPEEQEAEIEDIVPARTPVEDALVEIWSAILRCPVLSIHENFFALGGHSLLATRLISRVRMMFQIDLPLRSLFEAPTIALLAQRVENALRSGQEFATPPLIQVPHLRPFPLSFAQQRLWFLDQLEPASPAYLMGSGRRIQGELDEAVLEHSLQELIRRQASLRTIFQVQGEQPVQVVLPPGRPHLPVVDLSNLVDEQREGLAQQIAEQEASHPCDLRKEPPLRLWLLRLDETDHVLLVTMHHIISDAWSMQVFYRELLELYQTLSTGAPASLPPLPVQYTDFTIWQRQWLQGAVLEGQLAYWRRQLADIPPLALPTDHPRLATATTSGALETALLPAGLRDNLVLLSQQEGVTMFMLLLASFQVLLNRYTGQDDISVGTPIANRTRLELENLIGCFVNTLVLRTDLSGNPSFVDVLKRVREVALDAYAHQDVPFEQLVEELQPERDLSRTPLFQVMFTQVVPDVQEASPAAAVEKLRVTGLATSHTTSKFDLTFNVVSVAQGLHVSIEYSTALFETGTIRRMLQHWQTLLERIVAYPQAPLASLSLLTDQERASLSEWSTVPDELPAPLCIHELFDAQVQASPDAIAGIFEDEHLTYAALSRHANRLASHLRSQEIGPEVLVGICLHRSLELLISVLGVLKAGGAYLPLDPDYPPERLAFMLADARVPVLLTHISLRDTLPACQAKVLSYWPDMVPQDVEEDFPGVSLENLAYVTYTSGSTGTPRGVMIPHGALANHCLATAARYTIAPRDRVLQFASFSFDVAAEEIFPTLTGGATLVLCPNHVLTSFVDFQRLLALEALTVLNLPAPYWHAWVAELAATRTTCPESVRLLIAGSASVSPERFLTWQQCAGARTRWYNGYGVTEATVTTTLYEPRPELAEASSMPVGRPIARTRTYVLDRFGQAVPAGIVGELFIGGANLSRGYLNRPELTAARFLPDAFSGKPGMRVYRTGDRVRYLSTGDLEYLGRVDEQIKIRGYRVEPGEIEARLVAHPAVRESVVLAFEDESDNQQLVAYVLPEIPVASDVLQQYLREKLPDYMLPTRLITLEALPLTPNGKIDRHALLQLKDSRRDEFSRAQERLYTPLEEVLRDIWREVLRLPQVRVHDNFFELGGHSLLAMQLISRLHAVLQVDVPLRAIFETPTIEELARRVEELLLGGKKSKLPPIRTVDRSQRLPLSFAQQRLWFLDRLEPGSTAYLMASVRPIAGFLNVAALEQSFQHLIERHESLRTTIHTYLGEPFQVIHPPDRLWLPIIDLQGLSQQERIKRAEQLAQEEAAIPCDLEQGPLLRARVLRLEKRRHVLLLTVHHIISDGWSNEILAYELTTLYRSYSDGLPASLAPLAIQYADFAAWQREWLQGETLESLLDYWLSQLGGVPALKLPTDHPRSAGQGHRGVLTSFRLSAELSRALNELSRQEGVTLFMTLLAAYQVMFYRYTGQEDIAIGTDSASRSVVEVEGLIGFFVNLLVLRTDLRGNPSFREVLRRVREVVLGAYMHQDAPFELLVERLTPGYTLDRTPLIQTLFVMQNLPPLAENLHITVQQEHAESTQVSDDEKEAPSSQPPADKVVAAKFDLALFMQERAGHIEGTVNFRQDLFEADTIATMVARFQTLLQSIARQPDEAIDSLDFFTESALEQQKQEEKRMRKELRKLRYSRTNTPELDFN